MIGLSRPAAARWRSSGAGGSARSRAPAATTEDGERDDDPGAQLVEVLDQRQPVLGETALIRAIRRPQLRLSATTSPSTSRRPRPRPWRARSAARAREPCRRSLVLVVVVAADRAPELADPLAQRAPSSGSRLGPKTTSAMIRTTRISGGPMFGMTEMVSRARPMVRPRGASGPVASRTSSLEVQVEAGRGRLRLALVLAARLAPSRRELDRPVHAHERDLPDRHPVVDRDRQVGDVRELERQVALEAGSTKPAVEWISRPRRPSELLPSSRATMSSGSRTRSSVWPSTNSPGWRMNGSSSADLDQLGQVLHRLAHVDERIAGVVEDPEAAGRPGRRRSRAGPSLVVGVDDDAPGLDLGPDGAVAEHHRSAAVYSWAGGRRYYPVLGFLAPHTPICSAIKARAQRRR